jgi:hypothetical protein
MRRLEFSRPGRTATGKARNAGEAAQQLSHLTRERMRIGQERKALLGRVQKIDARLVALAALEEKLLPMMRKETAAKTAPPSPDPPSAAPLPVAPPLPAVPALQAPPLQAPPLQTPAAPPVRRPTVLPVGMSEVTLRY